jgi:hypothetical protein
MWYIIQTTDRIMMYNFIESFYYSSIETTEYKIRFRDHWNCSFHLFFGQSMSRLPFVTKKVCFPR